MGAANLCQASFTLAVSGTQPQERSAPPQRDTSIARGEQCMGEQQHIQTLSLFRAPTAEGLQAGEPAQPHSLRGSGTQSHWHRPTDHIAQACRSPASPRSRHHWWCLALTLETYSTSHNGNAAMPCSRVIN